MMATGLIHPVADGQITDLRAFALSAARSMGALITMRDEPMDKEPPREFVADTTYYEQHLAETQARLDRLATATEDERRAIYAEAMAADARSDVEYTTKAYEEYNRVKAMRETVAVWEGGPDGLKTYMLEQLDRALKDNDPEVGSQYRRKFPDYDEWFRREWDNSIESVGRAYASIAREKALTTSRNVWLAQLWASLPEQPNA